MLHHSSSRIRTFVFGLILLSVATAWSQQPRGPGRRGFPGPPGGRPPTSLLMLLNIPEVQKEIGADEEQKKQIEKLQDDSQQQMQSLFNDFPPADEPPEQDRPRDDFRSKMAELNQQSDENLGKLLTAKQLQRLRQLQLQNEGAAAFTKPEVAEKLALSEEQREKLREIQDRSFSGFGPPQIDPKDKVDAVALLSADQKSIWTTLVGEEFKFPDVGSPFGFGPGRGGPMGGAERKLVKQFDKNDDGWLNQTERKAAREAPNSQPQRGRGGLGRRGPGGRGGGPFGGDEEGKPGPKVSPDEVQTFSPEVSLYDPNTVRTLFLELENPDWEAELEAFHNTDVEVPAVLTVDGKQYKGVGVHFRGMSSYGMVRRGSKRSLNVSLDFIDAKQRLLGYKTLNLLNSHEDPTFMHTVLYSHIARQYIPAPKANFVKVVINGESWGLYVNTQQFDKIFASENYSNSKGTRWKVRGSPGGDGGLNYLGDKVEDYKRRYEIKSGDKPEAWQALITLCRTLKETPLDQLEAALQPMLDVDQALWFLALDNALCNSDGYWIRASDYCIYLDEAGKFHVVPHDMNETFQAAMGPGMGRGGPLGGRPQNRRNEGADERNPEGRNPSGRNGPPPEGRGEGRSAGGAALDPLIGMNDARKPLRSRLLAVPSLREKYLRNVRTIAENWLDWNHLGPLVAQYQSLIEKEVEQDTRKLTSLAAFRQSLSEEAPPADDRSRARTRNLRSFTDARRNYLLNYRAPD